MDLSLDVTEKALEVARSQIEEAATRAKELASRQLLQEVAEEKAAKKVSLLLRYEALCRKVHLGSETLQQSYLAGVVLLN